MPAALAKHTVDPAQEILDSIIKTGAADVGMNLAAFGAHPRYALPEFKIEFFANSVVVAVYHRPEKTASGLYLPQTASGKTGEDRYQGKVGLVVALGPLAYVDDDKRVFAKNEIVDIGDWVFFNPNDGWSCKLASLGINDSVLLRVFTEDQIKGRVPEPDMVW